jgi:hypothetical protein
LAAAILLLVALPAEAQPTNIAGPLALAGVDPPDTEPELPGPAVAADYVAPEDGPIWDPVYLAAGACDHPAGVLLHPAYARACAANVRRVEGHRVAYARLLDGCQVATAKVAEAVPDPVVLRCPECEAMTWKDRGVWAGVGGGAVLLGWVAVRVSVALLAGR